MITITIPRATVEQALEALENCASEHGHRCNRCDSEVDEGGRVVAALRAALRAALAQPAPEPVAQCSYPKCQTTAGCSGVCKHTTAPRAAVAEGLGPLPERVRIDPEPYGGRSFAALGYTADHMRAYAAQERAAERERWRELVEQLVACHEEPSCPAVEWARDMLAGHSEGSGGSEGRIEGRTGRRVPSCVLRGGNSMTPLREAAQRALEALEDVRPQNMGPLIHPAKQALRAALEQPEPEPVAWADEISFKDAMRSGKGHDVWPKAGDYEQRTGRKLVALMYATPPQQPAPEPVARKPLTEEEITDIWNEEIVGLDYLPLDGLFTNAVRAVERAHGIKE